MQDKIEKILEKELKKCIKIDEVPVAAVIIRNNRILSYAHNIKQKSNNLLNHAEIIAITKAEKKIKDWRLENCDLYVTLEPCSMCREVITNSRIKNVYYYNKSTFNKTLNQTNYHMLNNEKSSAFLNVIKKYFSAKR